MRKLKVGDKVRIKEDSEHYDSSERNPTCNGILEKNNVFSSGRYVWGVKWENGETNTYKTEDLELVETVTKSKSTITKEHLIELSAFFLIKGQSGIKYTKEQTEQMMIKKLKQICK